MARPKSDERRIAILDAATRVFAADGLGAPTAAIAKEAGISNGSLFTYFVTKADLLNALYLELKSEMASVSMEGLPEAGSSRAQLHHMWTNWVKWATGSPEKRRTLALLEVSGEIGPDTRRQAQRDMAAIAELLKQCRADGAMRDAPLGFVVALLNAVAEATIAYVLQSPEKARAHREAGFEALWRILA